MEHGLSSNGYSPVPRMDNPLSTRVIAAASQSSPNNSDKNSPNRGTLHVGFSEEKGEVKEKRERFLTAKYGVLIIFFFYHKIVNLSYCTFFRHIKWHLLESDWQWKCGFTNN